MRTWKTRLVNDYIKIIVHVYWNDPVGKLENLWTNMLDVSYTKQWDNYLAWKNLKSFNCCCNNGYMQSFKNI